MMIVHLCLNDSRRPHHANQHPPFAPGNRRTLLDLYQIAFLRRGILIMNLTNCLSADDLSIFRMPHPSLNLDAQRLNPLVRLHRTDQRLLHRVNTNLIQTASLKFPAITNQL